MSADAMARSGTRLWPWYWIDSATVNCRSHRVPAEWQFSPWRFVPRPECNSSLCRELVNYAQQGNVFLPLAFQEQIWHRKIFLHLQALSCSGYLRVFPDRVFHRYPLVSGVFQPQCQMQYLQMRPSHPYLCSTVLIVLLGL